MSTIPGRVRLAQECGKTIIDAKGYGVSIYHHIHLARISRAELRDFSGMMEEGINQDPGIRRVK